MIPDDVIIFLSTDVQAPKTPILILGAVLIINGLHLVWASLKHSPSKLLILYFSIGDYIWGFISISILLLGIWITTTLGIITTLIISLMVGTFGALQTIKGKETRNY